MKCVVVFDFLLFLHFVMYVVYGCEDFTHPLGREDKSRVKGLVGLENVFEYLGVWAPLYAIIIHILLGVLREVWCREEVYGVWFSAIGSGFGG